MEGKLNLLGAITAHVIYISSIIIFSARMIFKNGTSNWIGIPVLLMAFPLTYLLVTAPGSERPLLYYIQVGLMLIWLIILFFVDYIFKVPFRETQWMVISYVVLFFAGTGGMIGVASLAGKSWTISSVILFIIVAILAFVQRAVTGI
jgi:hypothetical protein